jgi:ribonucleoside-diphosphate reductase alpha chain
LAGEYIIVNKHLLKDLVSLGIWNDELKNKLSLPMVQYRILHEIPDNLKALYKTAWELSQKSIIEMAADRGAFICQSQSLNVFVENANFGKLSSMHFYAWEKGLKRVCIISELKQQRMPSSLR